MTDIERENVRADFDATAQLAREVFVALCSGEPNGDPNNVAGRAWDLAEAFEDRRATELSRRLAK